MPLYEYDCGADGVFELHRSVQDFDAPAACPICREPSPRILSVPGVAFLERGERVARDRNERSCHEPRTVERPNVPDTGSRPWQATPSGGMPWAIGHG
jgi:putative FmdB family regulatory protein